MQDKWRQDRKEDARKDRQKEAAREEEKQSERDADSVCLLSFSPSLSVLIGVSSLPLTKC